MGALYELIVIITLMIGFWLAVMIFVEVFVPPLMAFTDYPATRRLIDYHNRWWSFWEDKSREWRNR